MDIVDGALSRTDPRVKVGWLAATLICGLTITNPITLAAILVSIVTVTQIGGVLPETLRRMRGLVAIIVILGLIFGFTVPGEPFVGVTIAGVAVALSRDGLNLGLISALRMCIFAAPLLVVVISTRTSDLIQGLMALRLPLDYAMMLVLAFNFIPLYIAEMERIADAQKARGYTLLDGGFIGRLRGLVPIFIPLTLNAVDRSDTVGKVLEMRGLSRRKLRPEFERLGRDSWALLATSIVLSAVAIVGAAGWLG